MNYALRSKANHPSSPSDADVRLNLTDANLYSPLDRTPLGVGAIDSDEANKGVDGANDVEEMTDSNPSGSSTAICEAEALVEGSVDEHLKEAASQVQQREQTVKKAAPPLLEPGMVYTDRNDQLFPPLPLLKALSSETSQEFDAEVGTRPYPSRTGDDGIKADLDTATSLACRVIDQSKDVSQDRISLLIKEGLRPEDWMLVCSSLASEEVKLQNQVDELLSPEEQLTLLTFFS